MKWLLNLASGGAIAKRALLVAAALGALIVLGAQTLGVNPPEMLLLRLCGS